MICSKCNLSFGSKNGLSQHERKCDLTVGVVDSIRKSYIKGDSINDLHNRHGVSRNLICKIIHGTQRNNVESALTKKRGPKKHTEEAKQKMRESRLKWMKENPDKTAWRLSNMSYPEKVFLNRIKEIGLDKKYLIIREKSIYPYYVDFAFENEKVAVEIDGSQHQLEERKNNDLKKDELLNSLGWRIIRFTAREVNLNVNNCMDVLNQFIKGDVKFERVGIYNGVDFKDRIKLKCTNCDIEFYKRKIKRNELNKYFCSISCSTSHSNRIVKKFKKKKIQKKIVFNENINLVNRDVRKVERPSYDKLIEDITMLGYAGSGRKYNVSPSTVRKWLGLYEKYGPNF